MNERFIAKFKAISLERLGRLEGWLLAAEDQSLDEASHRDARREMHTLKGDARLLGLDLCASVGHLLEELWHRAADKSFSDQEANDAVAAGIRLLEELLKVCPDEDQLSDRAKAFMRKHAKESGPSKVPAPKASKPKKDGTRRSGSKKPVAKSSRSDTKQVMTETRPSRPAPARPGRKQSVPAPKRAKRNKSEPPPGPISGGPRTDRKTTTDLVESPKSESALMGSMRIDMADLDTLDGIFSDLRMRYHELRTIMAALAEVTPEHGQQTGAQQSQALRADLVRLTTRGNTSVQELFSVLERFEQVMGDVRLLPLRSVALRSRRGARALARSLGHKVRISFDDGDVKADAHAIETLSDALVHLLRNAVDHGIEPPAERLAAGKDETGTVAVRARVEGEQLNVVVEDDGRGIDLEKLKQRAIERRVLSPEAASIASEEELLDVLFMSGFSTREEVTDISGRGVGLDAVRAKVEAIGGNVMVQRREPAGTRAVLKVPMRASLTRALIVVSADGTISAVPTGAVHSIQHFASSKIVEVGRQQMLRLNTGHLNKDNEGALALLLPMHPADAGLGEEEGMVVTVYGRQRPIALRVAKVLGPRVVLQKPLGMFLAGGRIAVAAALLEDGRVASVVDVRRLLDRARTEGRRGFARKKTRDRVPRILVADDSEVTRDMVVGMLRDGGFEVVEAVNGEVALRMASQQRVDMVLTDLQMPVLDGFELIRRLRGSPRLSELPVCVFSTLNSKADRDLAAKCGADAYLVKTELRQDELIATIRRFVGNEQDAA